MVIGVMLIIGGFLVGSVASAIVVCRVLGLPDPRTVGSGNPGATNVLRHGGKMAAAITLAGDFVKGLLPVLIARLVSDSTLVVTATALAAFLGHLFPVFFGFRGGKGVATAFGAITGLLWPVALVMLIVWVAVAAVSRYSSLSALTAAALAPVTAILVHPEPVYAVGIAAMTILIFWRHRSNIRNLLAGTEGRLDRRDEKAG